MTQTDATPPLTDFSQTQIAKRLRAVGIDQSQAPDHMGAATVRRFAAGATLFRQADEVHSFLLLDGFVRLARTTPQGDLVVLHHVTPGNLFGITKATERESYSVTARAATDCLALSWPVEHWDKVSAHSPDFGIAVRRTLGARMAEMAARLVEMATRSVKQRIALSLLRLADQAGQQNAQGLTVAFPVTRQDISDMTGANMHSVSRVMSEWHKAGIVLSRRKTVTVVRPERLAEISLGPV